MPLQTDLMMGELHLETDRYKKREREAERMLAAFFNTCDKPYLALSWGKQSICIAHMVYRMYPSVPMVFTRSWESYWLHNFEDVIRQFTNQYPVNWIDNYCDNVSWNTLSWKETRDLGQSDIQNMGKCVPDWNGVIMGLSKDESKARRITTSLKTTETEGLFRYTDGRYRCTPIQNWSTIDLAAYIYRHDIPLLNEYHEFGLQARTTARITRKFIDNNGLVNLKRRDMSAYNRIIQRFPDLLAKQ